jgi:hypothetical protein
VQGWGKLVAGALIGVAGTVYATNEELRKKLPKGARDLPVALRRRFETAVAAGREASSDRRAEILRALEAHEAEERARSTAPLPRDETVAATAPPVAAPDLKPEASDDVEGGYVGYEPTTPEGDATRPLEQVDEK